MKYQACFFDFDGVLADTEALHYRAFAEVLRGLGQELRREDYFERYIHGDDLHLFRALSQDRGLAWDAATLAGGVARKSAAYRRLLSGKVEVLYPGVPELLRRLAVRVPLVVVSMAAASEVEAVLNQADLRALFAVLISAEDAARPKPDPAPYLQALARLNAARSGRPALQPRECVVIEDTSGGVRSGKGAGMTVVALTHSLPADDLRRAGADAVLDGIPALAAWLEPE